MPELPEVECVRRTLEPAVLGKTIVAVKVLYANAALPDAMALQSGLTGRRIVGSSRHGKLLILHLDDGSFFTIHLRMTGQIIVADQRPAADHIHVEIGLDDGTNIFYRDMRKFGRLSHCPDAQALQDGPLANMGPDALALDAAQFGQIVGRKSGKLKNVLLDQRVLAGVGNIYADECLHRAGLSPLADPRGLSADDLERLHAVLRQTLLEALAQGGSSVRNFMDAEGRAGTFQHSHRVYRRAGQPCPVCGEAIARMVLAGRSTHFCPACQQKC